MRQWMQSVLAYPASLGCALMIGLGLFGSVETLRAQTAAWVTDDLEITLRSGAGNEYRILRMLPAGSELEILQRAEEWTRVRSNATEGWVRSIYLDDEPGASVQLERATEQLGRLREENRDLRAALDSAESRLERLGDRNAELTEDNQTMSRRLQEAGEGLALSDENKALRKDLIDLEREVQVLTREAERSAERERQDWFLAGAGVIVFGMLLGILLTRIRWRRRDNWGNL